MENTENLLSQEKIGKLVAKFSIPCVISMVVAALYNIVDQIYIGWSSAGAYGNAATGIVYPFTVFALGFALLIGDGASANFSLFSGASQREKADKSIGNGIVMLVIVSAIITAVGLIFRERILAAFGANPAEEICYNYACDYYIIICIGVPVYMIGQGLNGCIRADGSPKYAMACTLAGAVANIILDPVFIFTLNQGVKGAAIATVIGQLITFAMSVIYLFKAKSFTLNKKAFSLSFEIEKLIVTIGFASLIVQLSIVAISVVNNNLLGKYGYETLASTGVAFGAVTPIAVIGIVMKVFGIVISIVIGISLGGQPIIGYNMGAGNIRRVKECITYITVLITSVSAVFFAIFELAPDIIISVFGSGNSDEYIEFARLSIRIFLCGIILTSYIKSSSIILQSMGNSLKSTIVALTRDVIVFLPATIIIASFTHNIISMLWAALIADIAGALLAFILTRSEIRKFEKSWTR